MNNNSDTITIAGAGPAGMTAAILLAKSGYTTRVYEQRSTVGSRFNDDFQGLENWSRDDDVFDELMAVGIEPNWWHHPIHNGTLYDPKLRPIPIKTQRPLFYMVRRGALHENSLDLNLFAKAKDVGVEFVFNKRADLKRVDIVAGGPVGPPKVIAAGMTFDTKHEDMACGILNDDLAPAGYVYLLISGGRATLATVLFKDFKEIHTCMQRSIETIKFLFGITEFPNSKQWGGYGSFSIPETCERDGILWVGEAAGFQDFLFGFGIRNAIISGKLAAQSIIENRSYDKLWKARLLPQLKASRVNRSVYGMLGNVGKRAFWNLTGGNNHPERFMKWMYSFSPLHQIANTFVSKIN